MLLRRRCPHSAQQQTRRTPLLSIDGIDGRTHGQTDARPFHRPCSAYSGSVNNDTSILNSVPHPGRNILRHAARRSSQRVVNRSTRILTGATRESPKGLLLLLRDIPAACLRVSPAGVLRDATGTVGVRQTLLKHSHLIIIISFVIFVYYNKVTRRDFRI